MEKAPIWITVYDRPEHFRSCVESLAKNPEALDTTLYISSDGPLDDISAEKVIKVRDYIKSISGFKRIISFLPKINTNSEIKQKAYNELRSNHSRYIHTEDDNIFSVVALNYFNNGLDIYEERDEIIAVSGYMYPGFPAQHCEQVFLQCVAGWGLALWRDKDLAPTFDEKALSGEALADKDLFREINRILPNSSPMIKAISEGRLKAGDITRSIYAIKHSKYSVHPSISVVRNIGHDGSGENCGVSDLFDTQEICTREITFNLAKPIKVSSLDQKWVSTFMGGWFAQVHGWLIFLRFNANNISSRAFYQGLLKVYGFAYRVRQFVRQI